MDKYNIGCEKILKVEKKDLINSYYNYAAGYYESGMELLYKLMDNNRYSYLPSFFRKESIKLEEENRIYPIMFLFRQYVELIIKALYLQFQIKTNQEDIKKIFSEHSLNIIWPELKNKLEEMEKADLELDGLTESINDTIQFYISIDNKSFNFRYPTNKDLDFYFKNEEIYDLEDIRKMMERFEDDIHWFI